MKKVNRILYIGQYGNGSTSKMRGEILKKLLSPESFHVVDIEIPLQKTHKILRSVGWRFKMGPLIDNINQFIVASIEPSIKFYDLIWVDKGVFIHPEVTHLLRNLTRKLIHFTPDPAFTYHRSNLFFKSLNLYDFAITTKSFEIEAYKRSNARNILYCTQGYDPEIHKPYFEFVEKAGISFIGHIEENREIIVRQLVNLGIQTTLAGIGWDRFARKNKGKSNLNYLGKGVYGSNYAKTISASLVSLGFLSKIIPELHTTRTIEIPACGTALITEKTPETTELFNTNEVYFVEDPLQWTAEIVEILKQPKTIEQVSQSGYKKITSGAFQYEAIMSNLLLKMDML